MQAMRNITGAMVGIGLIVGSIAPAQARPGGWGDRGWNNRGWHRHHDNGFNFGDAIGIAALIGAVAVIASSASKDSASRDRATQRDSNRGYSEPPVAPDAPPADDQDFSDVPGPDAIRTDTQPIAGEDRAVDACAIAARDEATRSGGYAEVRRIGAPQPVQGGYNIDGEVERRASYRDAAGETRRFTCSVQGDQVAEVYLSRDLVSN